MSPGSGLLAKQFERVINVYHARGYKLVSFQLASQTFEQQIGVEAAHKQTGLVETIIAVFQRVD